MNIAWLNMLKKECNSPLDYSSYNAIFNRMGLLESLMEVTNDESLLQEIRRLDLYQMEMRIAEYPDSWCIPGWKEIAANIRKGINDGI